MGVEPVLNVGGDLVVVDVVEAFVVAAFVAEVGFVGRGQLVEEGAAGGGRGQSVGCAVEHEDGDLQFGGVFLAPGHSGRAFHGQAGCTHAVDEWIVLICFDHFWITGNAAGV